MSSGRASRAVPFGFGMVRLNLAVGVRIAKVRKRRGLSQAALAKLIGISRVSVTNMEAGHHGASLHRIYVVASILKVPVTDLIP